MSILDAYRLLHEATAGNVTVEMDTDYGFYSSSCCIRARAYGRQWGNSYSYLPGLPLHLVLRAVEFMMLELTEQIERKGAKDRC